MWLLIPLFFLIGSSALSCFALSIHRFGLIPAKEEFDRRKTYYSIPLFLKRLFRKESWENLFFILSFSKQISRLSYAVSGCAVLSAELSRLPILILDLIILISLPLLLDVGARLLAKGFPKTMMRTMAPLSALYLLLYLPITFLFLKFQSLFSHFMRKKNKSQTKLKEKILEIVHESEVGEELTNVEQRLITSVAGFKDRIVREVMVPRIDVCSLPAEMKVSSAASIFVEEEYSRIPIYKESVDQIIGVIHFKDLLEIFVDHHRFENPEKITLEKIAKPLIYTPETKKITSLLTEFRTKKIHMAIVVNEFGEFEGIVSIEDILEELVGEIADEYDQDELILFSQAGENLFDVDAKMNIHEIERELGIVIPSSNDYDTIGGFVFHRAGAIPNKGFRIHHDNFDLEVIEGDERRIQRVRLRALKNKKK
ncbi:MAG: hemolysin family protein [Simkaniaceae bacterium]